MYNLTALPSSLNAKQRHSIVHQKISDDFSVNAAQRQAEMS
jgi:hypothetical protein